MSEEFHTPSTILIFSNHMSCIIDHLTNKNWNRRSRISRSYTPCGLKGLHTFKGQTKGGNVRHDISSNLKTLSLTSNVLPLIKLEKL